MGVSPCNIMHPISCVDMVPTIYYFVHNWRTNHDSRNGMVWTIRGLLMLLEASLNLIMHLRKGMSRISSNECLSSWHSIPFSVQRCSPKSGILWAIWESTLTCMAWWRNIIRIIIGSKWLVEAPFIFLMHLRSIMRYSSSNGCLFLQCSIPFPVLILYPSLSFCVQLNSQFWHNWHGMDNKELIDAVRSFLNLIMFVRKDMSHFQLQWVPLLME